MLGTVEAIRQHLTSDGLVARYQTAPELDGLLGSAHARHRRAKEIFWPRGFWKFATMSACYPSNTMRISGGSWGTFLRPSRTWASSTRRAISRGAAAPPRTERRAERRLR